MNNSINHFKGLMRVGRRRFLQGAALSAAAALGSQPLRINLALAAQPKIAIGFPVPLTGPYSKEAQDQSRAAQLAVDRFNAQGGLDGRMAELLIRDDMLTPGVAAAVSRTLIRDDGARFIVGSLSASVQLSVARVADAAGAVYVSISQSDAINEKANAGWRTFHEALNPHMTCQAVGRHVFRRARLRVAYLVADYAYGHEMARGMRHVADEYGCESVLEIRHPIATDDFTPFLPNIQEAKPDVLCLCNFGRDQLNSVRDAAAMGLKAKMQLVTPVLLYHQRKDGGPEMFDGVIGATNYHWTLERTIPTAKAFNDAYREQYGVPPSDYGAYGFGGVSALLSAMKAAKSDEPGPVAEALRTLEYDHYKGKQRIRACDGQSVQAVFVVASKAAAAMQGEHDIFELLTAQPADERYLRTCQELGY